MVKSIILYDGRREVMGFVEIKAGELKIQHNYKNYGLILSVNDFVFDLNAGDTHKCELDLAKEIFVSITRKDKSGIEMLASGIINQGRESARDSKVAEIDKILRDVCYFDDEGINACKKCPYRENFFEFKLDA